MYKLSTFMAQGDHGYSAVPLFGPADAVFEKTASNGLLPEVLRYITNLKPRAGSQYVLVNAMGAGEYYGSNINGDHFEEAGLIHKPSGWTNDPLVDRAIGKDWTYGFPTFYNAYPYAHHKNKDSSRAYGEVELAVWNDQMKRVELVCRIDHDKCEKFGGISVWDKLKTGMFPDVSMGSKVCYDLSSITTDWDLYRQALDTYDPKKFAYPGLAALDFHKKLKAKDGVGIRGLSITRNDYDEWTKNHMNRILPDGRKVWVYNPYPRFFDISFVFIGADRTAKTMVFIVKHGDQRYVPSAEAGEKIAAAQGFDGMDKVPWVQRPESPLVKKLLEEQRAEASKTKLAHVVEELAKVAEDSSMSLIFGNVKLSATKEGEIEKEVIPSQFAGKAVPLLEESDEDLPDWAVDALSSVPEDKALGTTAAMGIVLKPKEFQRILLLRAGKKNTADELASANEVFPASSETTPMDLGESSFLPGLARLLMPLLAIRSALGPLLEQRLLLGKKNGDEPPTSHSSEELRKIGAAYNGYRQALMETVGTAQDVLPLAAPADLEVSKLASAPPEHLFTPLSFAYLKLAHLPVVGKAPAVVSLKSQTASVGRVAPSKDTCH